MSNVIGFPASYALSPSQVDPPLPPEYHRALIEMEHEIAELRDVVAVQAIKLIRYRRRHFKRGLQKRAQRSACIVSLATVALVIGWNFYFPVVRNIYVHTQMLRAN